MSSDGSGSAAGWLLDWVKVTDTGTGAWWKFACNKWLDDDKGDSLSYNLPCTESS